MITRLMRCIACGHSYPMVLYYPGRAPHGPLKDCTAPLGWVQVDVEESDPED